MVLATPTYPITPVTYLGSSAVQFPGRTLVGWGRGLGLYGAGYFF